MAGDPASLAVTAGATGSVVAGAACTRVIGAGAELWVESALLGTTVADAVFFTVPGAAAALSWAGEPDATSRKTAHAQMSCLVEVDIGLRQGC